MRHKCHRMLLSTLIITLLTIAAMPLKAQDKCPDQREEKAKRELWFKEMQAKKHQYLIKELKLTPEQQNAFFEIYDKMEADLRQVNDDTRRMERKTLKDENATDEDIDKALDAIYNQRYLEWNIEQTAREKMSRVLTKRQLLMLKKADARFARALMKQHRHSQQK